jgi:hypothetical protein
MRVALIGLAALKLTSLADSYSHTNKVVSVLEVYENLKIPVFFLAAHDS